MSGLIGHRGLLLNAGTATGPAYRYWRVNVTLNNGGTFVTVHEAEFRATTGGADLTTPATPVTASSSHSTTPVSNVIDNNLTSSWSTNSLNTGWFRVDLGSAQALAQVTLRGPDSGFTNRGPRDFAIEGSSDGATWVAVRTFSAVTWAASETKAFDL